VLIITLEDIGVAKSSQQKTEAMVLLLPLQRMAPFCALQELTLMTVKTSQHFAT
jgi:hypothetical protein